MKGNNYILKRCFDKLAVLYVTVTACMVSHVWLFVTPWTAACPPPLSMGNSRQEYQSGLPFPPPTTILKSCDLVLGYIFCVCVCVCLPPCLVTSLCLTLCNTLDCNLPDSSVHGILQARILKWVAISFSRGSSWPRNRSNPCFLNCLSLPVAYSFLNMCLFLFHPWRVFSLDKEF